MCLFVYKHVSTISRPISPFLWHDTGNVSLIGRHVYRAVTGCHDAVSGVVIDCQDTGNIALFGYLDAGNSARIGCHVLVQVCR